jgi:hypothetical protein
MVLSSATGDPNHHFGGHGQLGSHPGAGLSVYQDDYTVFVAHISEVLKA